MSRPTSHYLRGRRQELAAHYDALTAIAEIAHVRAPEARELHAAISHYVEHAAQDLLAVESAEREGCSHAE